MREKLSTVDNTERNLYVSWTTVIISRHRTSGGACENWNGSKGHTTKKVSTKKHAFPQIEFRLWFIRTSSSSVLDLNDEFVVGHVVVVVAVITTGKCEKKQASKLHTHSHTIHTVCQDNLYDALPLLTRIVIMVDLVVLLTLVRGFSSCDSLSFFWLRTNYGVCANCIARGGWTFTTSSTRVALYSTLSTS